MSLPEIRALPDQITRCIQPGCDGRCAKLQELLRSGKLNSFTTGLASISSTPGLAIEGQSSPDIFEGQDVPGSIYVMCGGNNRFTVLVEDLQSQPLSA